VDASAISAASRTSSISSTSPSFNCEPEEKASAAEANPSMSIASRDCVSPGSFLISSKSVLNSSASVDIHSLLKRSFIWRFFSSLFSSSTSFRSGRNEGIAAGGGDGERDGGCRLERDSLDTTAVFCVRDASPVSESGSESDLDSDEDEDEESASVGAAGGSGEDLSFSDSDAAEDDDEEEKSTGLLLRFLLLRSAAVTL